MSHKDRWLITFLLLVLVGIQALKIRELEKQVKTLEHRPPIVYQADSYGGQTGKVMAKRKDGDVYYVEILGYGRFLITKEQFDSVVVGEDAPKEIMQRGS